MGLMIETNENLNDGRVAEVAAGWFVRLQGEVATADDWLAFELWLQASSEHAQAYERLEGLWIDLEYASLAKDLEGRPITAARQRPGHRRASRAVRRRVWMGAISAIAASVAVAVGVGVWSAGIATQTYQTPAGRTQDITLADGTRIRMNAASKITVSLGRDARRVQMADAEAVFDVTHDARRPFLISVGDQQVRVVGTEFNLRHRADLVDLTVRRGVVEVRPANALDATPRRVAVGQELTHSTGDRSSFLRVSDPDQVFAWTHGQLIYRDQPLLDVAADLSRRFATPVRTADAQAAALRFSGVLVTDNEPDVLRRLEAFAPVRVERVGAEIILHHR